MRGRITLGWGMLTLRGWEVIDLCREEKDFESQTDCR